MNHYTKECSKCQVEKDISEFNSDNQKKDKLASACRSCNKVSAMESYWRNAERSRERLNLLAKARYKNNPIYAQKQAERMKEKKKNPIFRMNENLACAISTSLKRNTRKLGWEPVVGFTKVDLMKHLESLFQDGMTWENYGRGGWHIDHIIPKSFFQIKECGDDEFKKCWDLKNLRPLWEGENVRKSNKMPDGIL